jgi:hypothetical protein
VWRDLERRRIEENISMILEGKTSFNKEINAMNTNRVLNGVDGASVRVNGIDKNDARIAGCILTFSKKHNVL